MTEKISAKLYKIDRTDAKDRKSSKNLRIDKKREFRQNVPMLKNSREKEQSKDNATERFWEQNRSVCNFLPFSKVLFLPKNTLRKPENALSVFQDKLHISNGFAKARYEGKASCRVFQSKGETSVKSSQRGDLEEEFPDRFLILPEGRKSDGKHKRFI